MPAPPKPRSSKPAAKGAAVALAGMTPLSWAIAVSLAIHAVLLSIHFKLPDALERAADNALDIILVNSKQAHKPVHAQAKAQTNLDGGGNTDENRIATTPLPPSQQVHDGDDIVESQQRRVEALEAEQRMMMTRLKADRSVNTETQSSQSPMPPTTPEVSGLDLATRALAIARLEGQIDRNLDEYNKRPRKMFIGARAEEYIPAQYLEDWRQKVERVGNLNYPEAAKGKLYGNLLVYIEINSEGELIRAEVQRSSGYKVLDEAALRILRLAAPYGKFSAELKRQADILTFARTWTFTQGDQLQSQ
jgi:periplasmic protein TonB